MTEIAHEHTLAEEFSAGLASGELLIQTCGNCGRPNMYPRHHCPFCQSTDLSWTPAVGTAVLHSFTVVRAVPPRGFESELPYALGVVKLDEGVQLVARLEPSADGDWDHYACDARVVYVPRSGMDADDRPVAWFAVESDA